MRKVNELIKRARMLKVHVHILNHLRNQFGIFGPPFFPPRATFHCSRCAGKEKTQQKLLTNLLDEFKKVQRDYHLPMGDFPHVDRCAMLCWWRFHCKCDGVQQIPRAAQEL